jgi:O-methyltransferase
MPETRTRSELIASVRADGLTYLDESALLDLYDTTVRLESERIEGMIVEAGCALGGSAIVLAAAKRRERPMAVFDVFGMIPPPSDLDEADVHERYQVIASGKAQGIRGNRYYGYEEDLLERVQQNFRAHGLDPAEEDVRFVQGLFEDVLHIDRPVALAHIDGDWFRSVYTCLERIEPHLVAGSVMVIDDYDHWSGCRKAVDEYFAGKDGYSFTRKSRLHIVRHS